jgi:hypothetical protein
MGRVAQGRAISIAAADRKAPNSGTALLNRAKEPYQQSRKRGYFHLKYLTAAAPPKPMASSVRVAGSGTETGAVPANALPVMTISTASEVSAIDNT